MSSTTSLAPISASDLLRKQFDPLRWIVPEIIPEGLTLLAGPPKIGKSWLCLDLALAVAGFGEFLDAVKVETGDVVYLALDDTQRRLQERIRDRKLALVVANHTRKTNPDAVVEVAGAQLRLSSLIENVLMLRTPHADCDAILSVTGRDLRDQELLLEWNADGMYWWLRGPAKNARISLGREAVLDVLEREGDALTPKEVYETLHEESPRDAANPAISYDAVRQRMFQMRRAGILEQALFGRYFLPPADHRDENAAK